jgi:hypothetical protein
VIFLIINFTAASASSTQPMFITISHDLDKIIFDGKWSFQTEWKQTSLYSLNYDDGQLIQLRLGHQNNFVYVLVDDVTATHFNKGSDRAIICFDLNNNKTTIPNTNDYCFVNVLDGRSFVLQGGSSLGLNSYFEKIDSPEGFIGVSSVSDQNDRYSKIPHTSYEFRIPTELVGRSDVYGFYLGVYDSHSSKIYSWPQDVISDSPLNIPSPSKWGEMVSPDKTLPEFQWPVLALFPTFLLVIYLTKLRYRQE